MATVASVLPELGQVVYAGSDFSHLIQFCSSREGLDHIVQNQLGSNVDDPVRIWLNGSGPEASRCARIIGPGSGRTQPAC